MNFLVHAWLSYPNRDLTWGNMYADAYKGSSYKKLEPEKAKGVQFHRSIDALTDEHEIVKSIINSIRPIAGKMAPIYVDVAFDYWLHRYLESFNGEAQELIGFVHSVLESEVPEQGKMTRMLPHLLREHWLVRYGTYDGISAAMNGLNYRMNMQYDINAVLDILLAENGLMAKHSVQMFEYLKKELS
jgi:acyl carrier protein phosphodiesterase